LLDKTKPAASFRWQRVIGESFLRASVCQRRNTIASPPPWW